MSSTLKNFTIQWNLRRGEMSNDTMEVSVNKLQVTWSRWVMATMLPALTKHRNSNPVDFESFETEKFKNKSYKTKYDLAFDAIDHLWNECSRAPKPTRINVDPSAQDEEVVRLREVFTQFQNVFSVLIGLGQVMTDKVWALQKKPHLDGKICQKWNPMINNKQFAILMQWHS